MKGHLYEGPVRRLVTACDIESYSLLSPDEQRDQQQRLVEIQRRVARNAHLDDRHATVQPSGDGNLTAWPPDTSEVALIANYLRELHEELLKVNLTLADRNKLRLRIAVTIGLTEDASLGIAGRAPVVVSRLLNCEESREALRLAPGCPLVIVLDEQLYREVVDSRMRHLKPEQYVPVEIRDKHGVVYPVRISVPGCDPAVLARIGNPRPGLRRRAGVPGSAPESARPSGLADDPDPEPAPRARWEYPTEEIRIPAKAGTGMAAKAALAVAGSVVLIAAITVAAEFGGGRNPSPQSTQSGSATNAVTVVEQQSAPPSPSVTTAQVIAPTGTLYLEITDNHAGTPVFGDPSGGAASSNSNIDYDTAVQVACWAPNTSQMSSINAFYLIETAPWKGDYAPADTFANGDPVGQPGGTVIDPNVPECAAS